MEIPFDKRDGFIWMDNEMIAWADAKIHVLTHGLHYASCVFEGQRAYNGTIFKLREHTERLLFSARQLDFEIPYTADEIDKACADILQRNKLRDAYVRPVAWRGSKTLGVAGHANPIHLAIAAWEWPSYFNPEERKKGIRLTLADYRRPAPDTIPCFAKAAGLYMICTLAKHQAEDNGYTDALMLDYRGRIAETTGANIFFIRDGVIHTPVPDCFLDGITRRTVIGLARSAGHQIEERIIMPDELDSFSECFITGTAAEVTPVAEIDAHRYTPGDITHTLMQAYQECVGA